MYLEHDEVLILSFQFHYHDLGESRMEMYWAEKVIKLTFWRFDISNRNELSCKSPSRLTKKQEKLF